MLAPDDRPLSRLTHALLLTQIERGVPFLRVDPTREAVELAAAPGQWGRLATTPKGVAAGVADRLKIMAELPAEPPRDPLMGRTTLVLSETVHHFEVVAFPAKTPVIVARLLDEETVRRTWPPDANAPREGTDYQRLGQLLREAFDQIQRRRPRTAEAKVREARELAEAICPGMPPHLGAMDLSSDIHRARGEAPEAQRVAPEADAAFTALVGAPTEPGAEGPLAIPDIPSDAAGLQSWLDEA